MPAFIDFSDYLPDPLRPLTDWGYLSTAGTPGPGFAGVAFKSITGTQVSRTKSGRGVTRDGDSQYYEFTIQYHPMFREQFEVVDSFLSMRNPRRDPFYVVLPQYSKPRNAEFATLCLNNPISCTGAGSSSGMFSGMSSIIMYNPNFVWSESRVPRPGDMFNINDPEDFNHQKIYKIAAVETNQNWQNGTPRPSVNSARVHFSPALQRDVSEASTINFIDPRFRVIATSDVQEYDLNTNNLYSFSLPVEEIQA